MPVILYQFVPKFSSVADSAFEKVMQKVFGVKGEVDFCSLNIGHWHCCMLYQDTTPCKSECASMHRDKDSERARALLEDCNTKCMAVWSESCVLAEGENDPMKASLRHGDEVR